MKRLKYIILTLALTIVGNSCSDSFLVDLPPSDIVITSGGAIKTKLDLETAVNGLYGVMNSASAFGANHFTYQELTGDLAFVGVVNSGRFYTTNGWGHLSPDEGASAGIWNNLYTVIANANFILEYEGKIEEGETGESVAQLFAHAHAIRAYCYSVLISYFGANFGEGNQSLGVPLSTKYDIYQRLPRNTVPEVYDFILNDLAKARVGFTSSPGINKFNPTALNLLTARVFLYKKDYANAIAYAQLVYNDGASQFLPRGNVSTYFLHSAENNFSETLFQIYESAAVNPGSNDAISATWSSAGSYKQNWMSRTFWESFPSTDIRKTTWYVNNTYVNNLQDNPKPIDVRKYISNVRDVVQFRKSESVFILAEALYHTNPQAAATLLGEWVQTYRDTAYVVPATSGQALLDEILRQKGFEFFLEGHRLIDLKRNHKPVSKTFQSGNNFTAAADDYRFVWPIPISEIQTNPNMVQNPGY